MTAANAAQPRTPFRYHGGKQRLTAWINQQLPQRTGYCEPMAGLASVLLGRPPAKCELVNDLDGNVTSFWLTVRDDPDWLESRWQATPHSSRPHFDQAVEALRSGSLTIRDRAYWWSIAARMSWGGLSGPSARYALNYYPGCPTSARNPGWPPLAALTRRLQTVAVDCTDAVDLLDRLASAEDQVIYVDPPYPTSETAARDYPTTVDRDRLAAALLRQAGAVAVSGYPADWPELDEAPGWTKLTSPPITQTINSKAHRRRTEALWINYQPLQPTLELTLI